MLTIPDPISFRPAALNQADPETGEHFAGLPSLPGIYRLVPLVGESHISWSASLARRVKRLIRTFAGSIARIDCWPTFSKLDTSLLLYAITKQDFPDDYARRLRLRLPWFVGLSHSDLFPQLVITNRITVGSPVLLGPFPNRDAAQVFAEAVAGLFQIRRCPGVLHPSPDHPGCIYGEMNQCLRPCQTAVSVDEYATEVARVAEFLGTGGRTATRTLLLAREKASADLDFELASQVHKRLERVKEVVSTRDEVIADARGFSGIAVTQGSEPRSCSLRAMHNGCWLPAFTVHFGEGEADRKSIDSEVRARLTEVLSQTKGAKALGEHLALFSRWYRSSWRDGEWFPFHTADDVDYRKLVRYMSKRIQAC